MYLQQYANISGVSFHYLSVTWETVSGNKSYNSYMVNHNFSQKLCDYSLDI